MRPILNVRNLHVWFPKDASFFGKTTSWVKAVHDVCFQLQRGQTLGLVGESGSGKTTTALAILRALTPHSGSIEFCPDGETVHNLAEMTQPELRPLRRHMQMIFQDPFSSLNPRMTVRQIVSEPLKVNGVGDNKSRNELVKDLLAEAGLSSRFVNRYPHAFSGGQRQRIVIARALALKPSLIVCDEPVSALDVSVQAQIINLMMELKAKHNLAYLFIAHDLEVVRHIADRVAVMYAGRIVEEGPSRKVYDSPLHPYTQSLLASSPKPDPTRRNRGGVLHGEVPDPSNLPSGCPFHPRCPKAMPECSITAPAQTAHDERSVRCLLYEGPAEAPSDGPQQGDDQ